MKDKNTYAHSKAYSKVQQSIANKPPELYHAVFLMLRTVVSEIIEAKGWHFLSLCCEGNMRHNGILGGLNYNTGLIRLCKQLEYPGLITTHACSYSGRGFTVVWYSLPGPRDTPY